MIFICNICGTDFDTEYDTNCPQCGYNPLIKEEE